MTNKRASNSSGNSSGNDNGNGNGSGNGKRHCHVYFNDCCRFVESVKNEDRAESAAFGEDCDLN
jgi:hypothetical protein